MSVISSPKWANAEQTRIDCMAVFTHLGPDPVPFTADQNDSTEHGREIFARCAAGEFGEVSPYVARQRKQKRDRIKDALEKASSFEEFKAALLGR